MLKEIFQIRTPEIARIFRIPLRALALIQVATLLQSPASYATDWKAELDALIQRVISRKEFQEDRARDLVFRTNVATNNRLIDEVRRKATRLDALLEKSVEIHRSTILPAAEKERLLANLARRVGIMFQSLHSAVAAVPSAFTLRLDREVTRALEKGPPETLEAKLKLLANATDMNQPQTPRLETFSSRFAPAQRVRAFTQGVSTVRDPKLKALGLLIAGGFAYGTLATGEASAAPATAISDSRDSIFGGGSSTQAPAAAKAPVASKATAAR
jgi:hypothetical protein